MKKRLLSATLAVVCAMGAYAASVGDYIYSNTARFKVKGANVVTNGDFSNNSAGWTAADGTGFNANAWLIATVDGKTAIQSQAQSTDAGAGLGNMWQLSTGTYVYSYWAKADEGITSSTTLFYASSDGTTQDRVVSETVSIGTGWTQVVDTIMVESDTEYLVMSFTNIPSGTAFTDFEIYQVEEVYDIRVVERLIAYAESLLAEPDLSNGADDFAGIVEMMKSMILDSSMSESTDAMESILTAFNEEFDKFMNANGGNTNSGDWTTRGYANFNNLNNATVVGSWKTIGTRWGFSPNDGSLERPVGDGYVLSAGIQTSFDLDHVGVKVERTDLVPGKYFFAIEAQGVAAANKAQPYGSNHTQAIVGPSIFIGTDTLTLETDTLNGYYWKRYYRIVEIPEGQTVEAGFMFPTYTDKRGGRYSLRNPEFRMIGKTELELTWESAVRAANVQQIELKKRLDLYKDSVAALAWAKDSLDRAIEHAQPIYIASLEKVQSDTESTVEVSEAGVKELNALTEELLAEVNALGRAINYVISQNAIQDELKATIAAAQEALDNPLNASADQGLRTALQNAVAEGQTLIANISSTNQYTEFEAAINKIQSAQEAFAISAANRANPAALILENIDFSQSSNKPAGGLSKGWNFIYGADMRDSQDWQLHAGRLTIMDESVNTFEAWRGTTAGPNGAVKKTFTLTTPGLYEFRAQAIAGDDTFSQYMNIAKTIENEEGLVVDTIYNPNIRVFFGLDGKPDSLVVSKCAPAAHLSYSIYTPMAYSVFYKKTSSTEETVEIGLEALDNGAAAGANFFGLGGCQVLFVGDETQYVADTKADLTAKIAEANGVIASASEDFAWIVTKIKRYIADGESATTAKELQNAYLSLTEMLHLLDATVTGIDTVTVNNNTGKAAEGIYTISGVKVSKATKPGLYIINGKKVVVK